VGRLPTMRVQPAVVVVVGEGAPPPPKGMIGRGDRAGRILHVEEAPLPFVCGFLCMRTFVVLSAKFVDVQVRSRQSL